MRLLLSFHFYYHIIMDEHKNILHVVGRDRWQSALQNDDSALDRQELERLNSLMDMRVSSLSAELAERGREKLVRTYVVWTLHEHAVIETQLL